MDRGCPLWTGEGVGDPGVHHPLHPQATTHQSLKDRMQVVWDEVCQLIAKQAVWVVSPAEAFNKPGSFYSKLFCVRKQSGSWRPIINLKPMNKFVAKQNFKMETVRDMKQLFRPGDYGTTVDLQDAFYHVIMAQEFRPICVKINNCTNKEGKGNCVCTFSMEGRNFEEKKSSVRTGKKLGGKNCVIYNREIVQWNLFIPTIWEFNWKINGPEFFYRRKFIQYHNRGIHVWEFFFGGDR